VSKPVYNLKIDAIKRLFCTISLFLSAWAVLYLYTRYRFFSPFAVLDVSALQEREWMHIAVFVMAIITGIFVLPVFLDNQLQRGTLLKSVIGYALCTYLCAISSLYSKSLYQIIVDNYDEKYGSSYIGDLVIIASTFAPIGLVLTLPFWLLGGWITAVLWIILLSRLTQN
tara:strand:+ start:761 stop:1270 length:510 start_codon:yes stop_codon:yes gene_type:complete